MTFHTFGGWTFAATGAAALCGVAFLGCAGEEPTPAPAPAAPVEAPVPETTMIEAPDGAVVFSVPDMHCEIACAPKVKEALVALPGVEKVETDVDGHTATVYVKEGFDEPTTLAVLADAGYPGRRISK